MDVQQKGSRLQHIHSMLLGLSAAKVQRKRKCSSFCCDAQVVFFFFVLIVFFS